jgi:hypothetical protein
MEEGGEIRSISLVFCDEIKHSGEIRTYETNRLIMGLVGETTTLINIKCITVHKQAGAYNFIIIIIIIIRFI